MASPTALTGILVVRESLTPFDCLRLQAPDDVMITFSSGTAACQPPYNDILREGAGISGAGRERHWWPRHRQRPVEEYLDLYAPNEDMLMRLQAVFPCPETDGSRPWPDLKRYLPSPE
jgi:hypothetical protein